MSLLQVRSTKGNMDWFHSVCGHNCAMNVHGETRPLTSTKESVPILFWKVGTTLLELHSDVCHVLCRGSSKWPPITTQNCLLDIFDFLEDALPLIAFISVDEEHIFQGYIFSSRCQV